MYEPRSLKPTTRQHQIPLAHQDMTKTHTRIQRHSVAVHPTCGGLLESRRQGDRTAPESRPVSHRQELEYRVRQLRVEYFRLVLCRSGNNQGGRRQKFLGLFKHFLRLKQIQTLQVPACDHTSRVYKHTRSAAGACKRRLAPGLSHECTTHPMRPRGTLSSLSGSRGAACPHGRTLRLLVNLQCTRWTSRTRLLCSVCELLVKLRNLLFLQIRGGRGTDDDGWP